MVILYEESFICLQDQAERGILYFYRSESTKETATSCDIFDLSRLMKYVEELPDIPATEGFSFHCA